LISRTSERLKRLMRPRKVLLDSLEVLTGPLEVLMGPVQGLMGLMVSGSASALAAIHGIARAGGEEEP